MAALAAILASASASAEVDEAVKGALALQQKGRAGEAHDMLAPLVAARAYALGGVAGPGASHLGLSHSIGPSGTGGVAGVAAFGR